MDIAAFASNLVKSLTRGEVVEDGELLVSRIKKYTHPAYKQATTVLKTINSKNDLIKKLNIEIVTGMQTKIGGKSSFSSTHNVIDTVEKALPVVIENVDEVSEMIDKTWNDKVFAMGLTYRNANMLQFISMAQFVEKYARAYLNLVYIEEAGLTNPAAHGFADMPEVERKWVVGNALAFGQSLAVVAVNPSRLKPMLEIIPDINITADNAHTAKAVLGADQVDPMSMGFIPAAIHPIYYLRMRWTDMQNRWYDEAKEDLMRLQQRRMYLEELRKEGEASVKIQTELTRTNERINELKYQIAEAEKDAK